jgi:hypothetical protein
VLPVAGALVGALDGIAAPPCTTTTAPPGAKVTLLVHRPGGAAAVAVAMIAMDSPPRNVPALWLSVIQESWTTAVQATGVLPELRSTMVTLFGSAAR